MTLATAHVLKINPYFLTGESEWREDYYENVVRQFLIDKDYSNLADSLNALSTDTHGDSTETPSDTQTDLAETPVKKKRS